MKTFMTLILSLSLVAPASVFANSGQQNKLVKIDKEKLFDRVSRLEAVNWFNENSNDKHKLIQSAKGFLKSSDIQFLQSELAESNVKNLGRAFVKENAMVVEFQGKSITVEPIDAKNGLFSFNGKNVRISREATLLENSKKIWKALGVEPKSTNVSWYERLFFEQAHAGFWGGLFGMMTNPWMWGGAIAGSLAMKYMMGIDQPANALGKLGGWALKGLGYIGKGIAAPFKAIF
jgi:hypothetical protein